MRRNGLEGLQRPGDVEAREEADGRGQGHRHEGKAPVHLSIIRGRGGRSAPDEAEERRLVEHRRRPAAAPCRACCRRRRPPPRQLVLRLTEPVTLPPSASMAAVASSRDMLSSVPVSTNVLPASGRRACRSRALRLRLARPPRAAAATSSRFRGSSKYSRTDPATTGPISWTACSCSTVAGLDRVDRSEGGDQHLGRPLAHVADARGRRAGARRRSTGSARSARAGSPPTSCPSARAPSIWPRSD